MSMSRYSGLESIKPDYAFSQFLHRRCTFFYSQPFQIIQIQYTNTNTIQCKYNIITNIFWICTYQST